MVGFPHSVSGDLLTILGPEWFLDATPLTPAPPPVKVAVPPPAGAPKAAPARTPAQAESEFDAFKYRSGALDVLFRHFRDKREVWLTPFLYRLRSEMPELVEYQRKQLISMLQDDGVFRVEKRQGTPNDYSVLVVNWNHPLVRDAFPG